MPSAVWFGLKREAKEGLKYRYDASGNISEITRNGHIVAKYAYDAPGRLIREDNRAFGKTETYTYDKNGNILEKRTYTFPLLGDLEGQEYEGKKYTYDGDRLMKYGNETFAYDGVGNPTTYRGKSVSWINGRTMTAYDGISFTYDGRGGRTKKGNTEFTYSSGGKLLKQSDGLEFIYDASGVAGVIYNNATYLYRKDVQGNITALLDKDGKVVVEYKYDAWGNHAILDGNGNDLASGVGVLNPFRYRSYYYDEETDLYYLQTRYYDPEVGRFLSQDDVSYLAPDNINGLNLYAYCSNNPVMNVDPTGRFIIAFLIGLFVASVVIGAVAGGVTAAVQGQDVFQGILGGLAIGALIGLGLVIGIGLMAVGVTIGATIVGVASLLVGAAIIGGTAGVGVSNIISIIDSNLVAAKYDDLEMRDDLLAGITKDKNGTFYNIDIAYIKDDESRMRYVNHLFATDENIAKNWTKAQLLRELRYHANGAQSNFPNFIKYRFTNGAGVEIKQTWETYLYRFFGNALFG